VTRDGREGDAPSAAPSFDDLADMAGELAELYESASGVLSRAWSPTAYRQMLDGPRPAFAADLWSTLISVGWPDVMVSEDAGGGDSGLQQLCVLTEAAGAAAAPVPLGAAAGAAWCQNRTTDEITLVLPGAATLSADSVSGTWPVVAYGAVASQFVCLATDHQGHSLLAMVGAAGPGVHREDLVPLDRNPAARLVLDKVSVHTIGSGPDALGRHADAIALTQLAIVSELVGIADAANQLATQYAHTRVAFGRPIGSFQAIKHRLVDQRASIEIGRALVRRAADAFDRSSVDRLELISLAVFWAIEELRQVPEGALQIFGGIGFTWEHEAHVHLRRAATAVAMLGSRAEHRGRVMDWLTTRQRA
jgi:alkylation response protein AidB-like acyl-CoA dehydrogenase